MSTWPTRYKVASAFCGLLVAGSAGNGLFSWWQGHWAYALQGFGCALLLLRGVFDPALFFVNISRTDFLERAREAAQRNPKVYNYATFAAAILCLVGLIARVSGAP